jgi:hypothetical protein
LENAAAVEDDVGVFLALHAVFFQRQAEGGVRPFRLADFLPFARVFADDGLHGGAGLDVEKPGQGNQISFRELISGQIGIRPRKADIPLAQSGLPGGRGVPGKRGKETDMPPPPHGVGDLAALVNGDGKSGVLGGEGGFESHGTRSDDGDALGIHGEGEECD